MDPDGWGYFQLGVPLPWAQQSPPKFTARSHDLIKTLKPLFGAVFTCLVPLAPLAQDILVPFPLGGGG